MDSIEEDQSFGVCWCLPTTSSSSYYNNNHFEHRKCIPNEPGDQERVQHFKWQDGYNCTSASSEAIYLYRRVQCNLNSNYYPACESNEFVVHHLALRLLLLQDTTLFGIPPPGATSSQVGCTLMAMQKMELAINKPH